MTPPNSNTTHITIHTDGGCAINPGVGGWAAIVQWWNGSTLVQEEELSGGSPATTNNQMELSAVIAGLRRVLADDPAPALPITVISDSEYVTLNATDRLPRWKLNGWRASGGKAVKNKELWLALDALCEGRPVFWQWVKGHSGDPLNERADALASHALSQIRPGDAYDFGPDSTR